MHSSSPHFCYMPHPYHPSWLDASSYTWRRVQVVKLLIMEFPLTSSHFIPLRSKYPPQHSVYIKIYRKIQEKLPPLTELISDDILSKMCL
jgi:hypothetical protein